MPASRVTDGGSSQDGFLPHQEMAQREVRGSVGSALMAQGCFHTPLRSPNRQMSNAWKQQHRKEARKMNDSPKRVDCKVLNQPDKLIAKRRTFPVTANRYDKHLLKLPSFWNKSSSTTVLKNEADPKDVDQGKQSWQRPEVRRHEEEKGRCAEQGCWGPSTTSSSTYPTRPTQSETGWARQSHKPSGGLWCMWTFENHRLC